MATLGLALLIVAFAAALVSVGALAATWVLGAHTDAKLAGASPTAGTLAAKTSSIGRLATVVSFAALLACCLVLVVCFMIGDVSILYVLEERSLSTSSLAWLYKLAGLWAGRGGSLLFWAFLIATFDLVIVLRTRKQNQYLDDIALLAAQAVVLVFAGVLLFSTDNMPFTPTPEHYFGADGQLTAAAQMTSMNQLLEHWAMAIHPPTLFVGYAGFTIPFAYALAALATNDPSRLWVQRCTRYVLFSWLFLSAGIGLGAVWAYVVLGWGGYWGWDPVENASLLSWLVGVALIHTLTVYRQRGAFKRWGVMCACLAFVFVIVATFITRSGVVQSVHAFAGDPISLALFGGLIVGALAVSVFGIVRRWRAFSPDTEGADDVDSMMSKEAAYYFNNVIMMAFTLVLTYMTLTPALPEWMPFGGDSLSSVAYEAIARPLGIVYLLILAVCPLLAWGRTDLKKLLKRGRVPAICAVVLFIAFLGHYLMHLRPAYYATLAQGGSNAEALLEAGPPLYYNALAVVGFLVASLLFFNALYMFVRSVKTPRKRVSAIGGSLAHTGMAVILVGLIGSSMFVSQKADFVDVDPETGAAVEEFTIQDYTLRYADESITDLTEESNVVIYEVDFDVYRDGTYVGTVHPQVQLSVVTQQIKKNASVLHFPEEDLFVVYHGVDYEGDYSLEARVNPLISLVWAGFILLMAGALVAVAGKRGHTTADAPSPEAPAEAAEEQ